SNSAFALTGPEPLSPVVISAFFPCHQNRMNPPRLAAVCHAKGWKSLSSICPLSSHSLRRSAPERSLPLLNDWNTVPDRSGVPSSFLRTRDVASILRPFTSLSVVITTYPNPGSYAAFRTTGPLDLFPVEIKALIPPQLIGIIPSTLRMTVFHVKG